MKSLSVQDKTTFTSRMGLTRIKDVLAGMEGEEGGAGAGGKRRDGDHGPAAPPVPSDLRRREKENMAEFIAKKREIFLVQMSLDTKRAEIRKLEERALQVRGARTELAPFSFAQPRPRPPPESPPIPPAPLPLTAPLLPPPPPPTRQSPHNAARGGAAHFGGHAGGGRPAVRRVPEGE